MSSYPANSSQAAARIPALTVVQDPALRLTVLRVCVGLEEAAAHVDEGEETQPR